MMRSIWAVVAGFLFIGVFATAAGKIMQAMSPYAFNSAGATNSVAILVLMTVIVGVFGVVGCYITARLAPSAPMKHALILGLLGLIIHGVSMAMSWGAWPAWFQILNFLLVMPYAWYGGRLRENEIGSTPIRASAAA
jgi:hypothetical protein